MTYQDPAIEVATRIALVGIPFEKGAGTLGTGMAPAALRTAALPGMLRELGHSVADSGDLPAPTATDPGLDPATAARCRCAAEVAGWTRTIHAVARDAVASGAVPIFVGGDHSISMGTVGGISEHCERAGKELVVLWLDAHADYNTPASSPSGNMHGMSVAYFTGDPSLAPLAGDRRLVPVKAENVTLFGVRSIDPEERLALKRDGLDVVDMRAVDEDGVAPLMRTFLRRLDGRNVHLHVSFDADFLDPGIAPGVGTDVPGGTTFREAHLVMEMLHDSGLVGSLDVVELNPFLDERGRTARLVADLVASLFGRRVFDRRAA